MTPRIFSKAVSLAFLFVSGAWAQSNMAKCRPGWEWNQNSLGQDACSTGSALDAACRGLLIYTYPPMNSTQYYIPPDTTHDGDIKCDCNTVMYSLYMACSACQGGIVYSWKIWREACDNVHVSQYPGNIPHGTAVPRWAYLNIVTLPNETYTDGSAMGIGRDPEEGPKPINTVVRDNNSTSSGTTTLTPTNSQSSTNAPIPTNDSGNGSNGRINIGATAGVFVSSVVLFAIVAVAVFIYIRRRRQKPAEKPQPQCPELDPHEPRQPSMYGSLLTVTPYNPSDPSTFPSESPLNSVTYTTPPNNPRRGYSGIPEV